MDDEKPVGGFVGEKGYLRLHRDLIDKAIWQCSSPEHKVILITIMTMANHSPNEWEWKGQKFHVKPGQFITSLESIAKKSGKGISIQNVRTALEKFKKYNFLTWESTNTGRLITIEKWTYYNSNPIDLTNEPTDDQQTTNKRLTTTNNDNNDYLKKYVQQSENLYKLYPKKRGKAKAMKKLPGLIKKHGYEQMERAIKRYSEQVKDIDPQYIKNADTFFNGGFEDFLDDDFVPQQKADSSPAFSPQVLAMMEGEVPIV